MGRGVSPVGSGSSGSSGRRRPRPEVRVHALPGMSQAAAVPGGTRKPRVSQAPSCTTGPTAGVLPRRRMSTASRPCRTGTVTRSQGSAGGWGVVAGVRGGRVPRGRLRTDLRHGTPPRSRGDTFRLSLTVQRPCASTATAPCRCKGWQFMADRRRDIRFVAKLSVRIRSQQVRSCRRTTRQHQERARPWRCHGQFPTSPSAGFRGQHSPSGVRRGCPPGGAGDRRTGRVRRPLHRARGSGRDPLPQLRVRAGLPAHVPRTRPLRPGLLRAGDGTWPHGSRSRPGLRLPSRSRPGTMRRATCCVAHS